MATFPFEKRIVMIAAMKNYDSSGPSSELLRTFCAVADIGNVTQAASVLARTQSAISVQIRRLEEVLSVPLFERQARGVILTDEGERLLPLARKALVEIDRVGALFTSPLEGSIRVGIPDDYNETILERALAQFCAKHGAVEVFVRSGCTAGFPDAIAKNELDIAIYSAGPISSKDAFFSEPTVWAANADFMLEEDAPVPLAIFDRHCWWREVGTNALDKSKRSWRTAYLSENFSSVKAAIRAGLAVGTLAKSAVEDSMRVLGKHDGFPKLPDTSLALLKRPNTPSDIVQEMERAILVTIE